MPPRAVGYACIAAGLLLGLRPHVATAQSLILGKVRSGGKPVARAEVLIPARKLRAESSDSGTFQLAVAEPGRVDLLVRAIGYKATAGRLELGAHDTITIEVSLERGVQRLDSVGVEAPPIVVSGKMRGFEERRLLGFGKFFTREMLAEKENSIVSNVLRTGTGLRMMHRPETCGGGWAAASGRGGSLVREACGPTRFDPACYMAIFLDGVRIWAPGFSAGDPPPDVDRYKVSDFEGIEVYRSVAEAPIQYQVARSDCGVLVLWTRVGGG